MSCPVLAVGWAVNIQRALEPRALPCTVGLSLWETWNCWKDFGNADSWGPFPEILVNGFAVCPDRGSL